MAPCDNQVAQQLAEMIIAELAPVYVIVAFLALGVVTAALSRTSPGAHVPVCRVRSTLLIGALVFIL